MLPKEQFISLERIGYWLRNRQYSDHAVFEALCRGELKAVIHHPLKSLQPFPIPISEWNKIELSRFRIREFNQTGQRRIKEMYINDEFAYDSIISQLRELLILAQAANQEILKYPGIDLLLDAEIYQNNHDALYWVTIHRCLVDRLIELQQLRLGKSVAGAGSRSRVFVLAADFEGFTKSHQIKSEPATAGRKRLGQKDQIWIEALSRFYTVHKKTGVSKVRAEEIRQYARNKLDLDIGTETINNILRVIDKIAVDPPG